MKSKIIKRNVRNRGFKHCGNTELSNVLVRGVWEVGGVVVRIVDERRVIIHGSHTTWVCIWLGQEAKLRDACADWRMSCAFRTGKYGKNVWTGSVSKRPCGKSKDGWDMRREKARWRETTHVQTPFYRHLSHACMWRAWRCADVRRQTVQQKHVRATGECMYRTCARRIRSCVCRRVGKLFLFLLQCSPCLYRDAFLRRRHVEQSYAQRTDQSVRRHGFSWTIGQLGVCLSSEEDLPSNPRRVRRSRCDAPKWVASKSIGRSPSVFCPLFRVGWQRTDFRSLWTRLVPSMQTPSLPIAGCWAVLACRQELCVNVNHARSPLDHACVSAINVLLQTLRILVELQHRGWVTILSAFSAIPGPVQWCMLAKTWNVAWCHRFARSFGRNSGHYSSPWLHLLLKLQEIKRTPRSATDKAYSKIWIHSRKGNKSVFKCVWFLWDAVTKIMSCLVGDPTRLNWCFSASVAFRVNPCLASYSTCRTRSVASVAETNCPNILSDETPCRKIGKYQSSLPTENCWSTVCITSAPSGKWLYIKSSTLDDSTAMISDSPFRNVNSVGRIWFKKN